MRLTYWAVDIRRFVFWFSVAFLAGAGPNLAELPHPAVLIVLTVVAAVLALRFWNKERKQEGIGVYVHFARPDSGPDQSAILAAVRSWMERHHRDWFRAGPDRPDDDVGERVDNMLASIRHRLEEIESFARGMPPLFIYVQCGLAEAFRLGQAMAGPWGLRKMTLHGRGSSAWPRPQIEWQVLSVSYRSLDRPYRIDLGKVIREIGLGNDLVEARPGRSPIWESPGVTVRPHRMALVLHAAETLVGPAGDEQYVSFVRSAERAAWGEAAGGYLIQPTDLCDRALVVRIPVAPLVAALRDGEAAEFVTAVRDHWREHSKRWYGTDDVPVRLFLQGPAILAFALAAVLPPHSRLIPWAPVTVGEPSVDGPSVEIVAIVDGDDVGAGMELKLLSRNLDAAIEYSNAMGVAMASLTETVAGVPGVSLISAGGDSAIFTMPRASTRSFERALENVRIDLGYRFSCGYGRDSREAFVALRVAKTMGKNSTVAGT